MPLVQPVPFVRPQWFDSNGDPVANGFLYTFAAGTNTPLATYNDHTGSPGSLNPNPVQLDSGGYADVWLTSSAYKLVLQDADHNQLWSIDGVPGLGSLISVGDLPPLFTTVFSAGGLSFVLDDAAPNTLFGRFAGTTGAPSYGAVGSDKQIVFNDTGAMVGDDDLLWDKVNHILTVGNSGGTQLRFIGTGSGGNIKWGSGTDPSIEFATDWYLTRSNGISTFVGDRSEQKGVQFGPDVGVLNVGIASHFASIGLNDGSSGAGVFLGPRLLAGTVADPNNVVSAPTGSLFVTSAGGANTTLWVKESSPTATTGWVAK